MLDWPCDLCWALECSYSNFKQVPNLGLQSLADSPSSVFESHLPYKMFELVWVMSIRIKLLSSPQPASHLWVRPSRNSHSLLIWQPSADTSQFRSGNLVQTQYHSNSRIMILINGHCFKLLRFGMVDNWFLEVGCCQKLKWNICPCLWEKGSHFPFLYHYY